MECSLPTDGVDAIPAMLLPAALEDKTESAALSLAFHPAGAYGPGRGRSGCGFSPPFPVDKPQECGFIPP